jgi:hypothetical protein
MTDSSVASAVRRYYEDTRDKMHAAGVGASWPAFEDLNREQLTAWMLAFSANIEVGARVATALTSVGMSGDES